MTRNHRPKEYRHKDEIDQKNVIKLVNGQMDHSDATVAERRTAIKKLYDEGYSDRYISLQTGIPRTAIQRARYSQGMPANYPRGRPKEGD